MCQTRLKLSPNYLPKPRRGGISFGEPCVNVFTKDERFDKQITVQLDGAPDRSPIISTIRFPREDYRPARTEGLFVQAIGFASTRVFVLFTVPGYLNPLEGLAKGVKSRQRTLSKYNFVKGLPGLLGTEKLG